MRRGWDWENLARMEARDAAEDSSVTEPSLYCPCCGVETDGTDIACAVAEVGAFDGYCHDCEPGWCPACDGDVSADETPLGQGRRLSHE